MLLSCNKCVGPWYVLSSRIITFLIPYNIIVSKKWGVFIFAEKIKKYMVWKNKIFIIAIYTY